MRYSLSISVQVEQATLTDCCAAAALMDSAQSVQASARIGPTMFGHSRHRQLDQGRMSEYQRGQFIERCDFTS
jgi:hypothetical protein